MICNNCSKDFVESKHSKGQKYCSTRCKNQYNYKSKNIKILKDESCYSDPRFDWEVAEELALKYNKPVAWIKRGLLACRNAGVEIDYFISRYLDKSNKRENKEVSYQALLINKNNLY